MNAWLDKNRLQKLDDVELQLFISMTLIYQGGKGNNSLVPVLNPDDTVQTMKKLADPLVRGYVGSQKRQLLHVPLHTAVSNSR